MSETANEKTTITLLVTSDLHGRLFPYSYMEGMENRSGSMLQLSSAIKELYDPACMILADCGDTVQANFAELFLEDEVHPLMSALNDLGYEIWTTGNHEYDFGMDTVKRIIHQFKGNALLGNVYDENGERIAKPYVILEKCGVRIAVLSMVTPNIVQWNEKNLSGYTVTSPIDETRKLLSELEGKYDVLIGIHHMGINDELGVHGSGVSSYLTYFPEFDIIAASHEHRLNAGMNINGVLVAENYGNAKSMIRFTIDLEKKEGRWNVIDKRSEAILMKDYEIDPVLMEKYQYAHERALEYTRRVIGMVMGDEPLGGVNPVESYVNADFAPTPLVTFLNHILRYYAEADVSCAALSKYRTNLRPGPVTVSDAAWLFPYSNPVCRLKMTGKQLRKYMEYNEAYYRTFEDGDLTITINAERDIYKHVFFSGVNYEINLSKPSGERIEHLTWPNGNAVMDEDEFIFAICSFSYVSTIDEYGIVLNEEDGLPELLDDNVHPEIGAFPDMIIDYIVHGLNGEVIPENENNWKLTGYSWDEELHRKAVAYLEEGLIEESVISDPKEHNCHPIRIEHILEAEKKKNSQ